MNEINVDEIDEDDIIKLEGEKGSSLFYLPLSMFLDDIKTEPQKKIDNLLEIYKNTQDDRALAIIGALIVEEELDRFLFSWIKKYDYIIDNKDLTFSFKVDLAISLNLIPVKIFNAIEPIRKIRNIFAHHLEIDSFEKAKVYDSKRKSKKKYFTMLHDKLETFSSKKIEDDKEAYIQLIVFIILGLTVYTMHVIKVQEYIWTNENLNKIASR